MLDFELYSESIFNNEIYFLFSLEYNSYALDYRTLNKEKGITKDHSMINGNITFHV